MRRAVQLAMIGTLSAGIGFAGSTSQGREPEGLDELAKEKGGPFKQTLVHPDADFSDYANLVAHSVTLGFREEARAPRSSAGSLISTKEKPQATLSGSGWVTLTQAIDGAVAEELGSSGAYTVVHEAGPDTLIVNVSVQDIATKNPPRSSGRTEPVLYRATVAFDLIDAESGVILARMSDKRKIPHKDDATEGLWSDVGAWVHQAAADLLTELERH